MRRPKQNIAADVAALKEQLNSVIATLAAPANAAGGKERSSWTLREFQHRHNLSESQYHKLRREGRAPRTMRTGAVGVRISRDGGGRRPMSASAPRAPRISRADEDRTQ